jgi:hypothetical protein
MKQSGLLFKTKLQGLIILVLCFQFLGSYQISEISVVRAEGAEPKVTVSSPVSGGFLKTGNITISGTVENYTAGMSISLFNGAEQIGTTNVVSVQNEWSIPIVLKKGLYNIDVKLMNPSGVTLASTQINNLTIDTIAPTITFLNPAGPYSNSPSIEMKTESGSIVQLCMDCGNPPNAEAWVTVNQNESGNWEYIDSQMIQGRHMFYAKATDRAGNVSTTEFVAFTLDTLRPAVLPQNILEPRPDMRKVSVDTVIKFKVSDATPVNVNIKLLSKGVEIPVDEIVNDNPDPKVFTFKPKQPLSRSTKYTVVISPSGLVDSASNPAFPRFWTFTTESAEPVTINGKSVYKVKYSGQDTYFESPHAVYTNNTNICGNCHSTHQGKNANLVNQERETATDNADIPVDNYCMACHDGTVAPQPENSTSTHTHNSDYSMDGKQTGSSCASCHNPHSELSQNNPNLIQGHITYTHDPTISTDGKPTGEISSQDQLCEKCHETDSAERIENPLVKYRLFEYKDVNRAVGINADYGLCLRCHDQAFQTKNTETADIKKYYDNLKEEQKDAYERDNGKFSYSEREISTDELKFSRHIIKAQDGSPLAGHIPCAECHDTHGSNNVKQLKGQIGHEKPSAFNLKTFESTTKEWNAIEQQTFCITCHNGSTAVYGIKGKEIYNSETNLSINPEIPDHNKTVTETTKPCSECHSTSKTFIEAAHAPKSTK